MSYPISYEDSYNETNCRSNEGADQGTFREPDQLSYQLPYPQ